MSFPVPVDYLAAIGESLKRAKDNAEFLRELAEYADGGGLKHTGEYICALADKFTVLHDVYGESWSSIEELIKICLEEY